MQESVGLQTGKMKNFIDKWKFCDTITFADAGIAHPVERHLAKVEVASSSLVARSITLLLMFCLCACDGIGRHARFRFSYRDACGFESHQAHHVKRNLLRSAGLGFIKAAERSIDVSFFFFRNGSLTGDSRFEVICSMAVRT